MDHTFYIPTGFNHLAGIYEPWKAYGTDARKYGVMLPPDLAPDIAQPSNRPEGGRRLGARSDKQPVIVCDVPGWDALCRRASDWRFPLDHLLRNRPLRVLAREWTTPYNRLLHLKPRQALALEAVQILGDAKCEELEAHICNIKQRLEF